MIAGVALMSWLAVGAIRRYAVARGILDQPKQRSSHAIPTPRGGGAGLAAAAIIGFLMTIPTPTLDWRIVLALLAVLPTAVAGWLDDHGSLPVLPRVGAQLASGLLILPLAIESSFSAPITVAVAAAWLLATLSAVNVVNFMDGIDGLIGLQTLVFAVHIAMLAPIDSPGRILGLALAASSAGFLMWNWSPARIFLGDVGSGAVAVLGLVGGILVWRERAWPFVAVFLPLLPIFLDASVTMLRRARSGEQLTVAHRSHLYQRLANDAKWGHGRVSLVYGAMAAVGTAAVLASPREVLAAVCAAYAVTAVMVGWLLHRAIHVSMAPSSPR
jgi:UDP-N-acetylmuramyl pentapeptide phosphotransferase/UDP-N-acetylglucosamine-1-phosphate transferase